MKKIWFYFFLLAFLWSGCSKNPSSPPVPGAGDIVTISNGETVFLEKHVVKGKYTIFEFYATW